MRKTKEEAAATRKLLLETALEVFVTKGFNATKLEDIAAQAGVTRGAIYWHFGSKTELYIALVKEISKRSNSIIEQAISEGGSFMEIMRRVLVTLIRYPAIDHEYKTLLDLTYFKMEMTDEVKNGLEAQNQSLINGVRQFIQAGIDQQVLRSDLNIDDTVFMILSLQQGSSIIWLLEPNQFALLDRAEGMVDLFIRSIAA